MPRPTRQPLRTEVAAEDLAAYDRVVERAADPDRQLFVLAQQASGTEVPVEQDAGYYGRLLLAPEMAYHLSEIGRLARGVGDRGDSYSHAERELVDQVLSADMHTNVIQVHHIPDALAAGVRLEAIKALRSGQEAKLDEEPRAGGLHPAGGERHGYRRCVGGAGDPRGNAGWWSTPPLRCIADDHASPAGGRHDRSKRRGGRSADL